MNIRHWLKMAWKKLLRLLGLRPWPRKVSDSDTSGEQKPPAPPVEPDPPTPTLPRLHIEGCHFRRPDGSRFVWIGLSAFRLLKMLADGDEAGVVRYLEWAASHGVTVLRVFSTVAGMFDLAPEVGRKHLPHLLTLAEARGLYVEVIGLADTRARAFDHQAHIHALGTIAAQHPAMLIEVANECTHPTQSDLVANPAYLASLKALVPSEVLVSLGAVHGADDESDRYAALSDYGTVHVSRQDGEDGWRHVRHAKEARDMAARLHKPIVDDEPAKETDPVKWRAKGLLARVLPLPGTFHFADSAKGKPPSGAIAECFDAWKAGLDALPSTLEDMSSFQNAGWSGCPVAGADFDTVLRVYSAKVGGRCYSVLLNLTGDPRLELRSGWRVDTKRQWGRVALWRLSK